MKYAQLVSVLLLCAGSAAGQEPQISRPDVERVLRTLASDDMQGRLATGDAIAKAAEFISGEFLQMGLEPVRGAAGYLQSFPAYGFRVASVVVEKGLPEGLRHGRRGGRIGP